MKHSFGYIKDGKVFLKGFLGRPDRVIGEVKGNEASTILYFETRFTQLEEKVASLKAAIEENQNKGSFLMKLIHLKESLYTISNYNEKRIRLPGCFDPLRLQNTSFLSYKDKISLS